MLSVYLFLEKVTDSIEGVTEYAYDALGQLLTETINGEVVNEMVYDNYGNILQKNGIRYTYSEGWNDRLACYDGKHITYDAQGNPLNYLGHTLTWEKGRQLKSFDSIAYTYNANGIRTSKTVDGIRHDYLLDGVNILAETWDDNVLETLYDNEENVCGIVYNGVPYYFHKNLQGDIIAIADQNGEVVARYTYDAWGKCEISVNSTNAAIAEINPYRYRGYYYDTELGMYYLQSRYYDPTVGRFINADEAICLGINGTVQGYSLFSYCKCDPVNHIDPTGYYTATLVLTSSLTVSLSGSLSGIMTSITASVAGLKTAIATSWLIPVCVAAAAVAIVGIVYVVKKVTALTYSAARVISAVKAKVKAKGVDPKKLRNYTVYVIVRKGTVDVVYVGMTKNYSARYNAHKRRFSTSKYTMMPVATGLTYSQARALEQTLICAYSLDTLVNLINSISVKRWSFFKQEFNQMLTLIESWIQPE